MRKRISVTLITLYLLTSLAAGAPAHVGWLDGVKTPGAFALTAAAG